MIFKEAELDIDPEAGGTSSHFFFQFAVPPEVEDVVHYREHE
jgi:hypothetical protein